MTLEVIRVAAGILIPFVLVFLGIIIAVFRHFLKQFAEDIKRDFLSIKEDIEKNDGKINQVERDFMNFKADLPRSFVMRDDYIRITGILENRIDAVSRSIESINGNVSILSSEIQVQGKDIKRLLNELGESNADRAGKD